MSPRLFTAMALTILALVVAVVGVSLARNNLDPAGVLAVLGTMFSGMVVAFITKGKPPTDDPEAKP